MADTDGLEGLEGLHQDLLAFAESRLPVVERLWGELTARIEEFRNLLDKRPRSDQSRQTLLSGADARMGKITVDDNEYEINDEFKQETLQVAEYVELDEVESAKLLLVAQEDAQELDRPAVTSAVIRFHKRRQFLLECLRLSIEQVVDPDAEQDELAGDGFRDLLRNVLDIKVGPIDRSQQYWRKCLKALADIEQWLQKLGDSFIAANMAEQSTPERVEILEYERSSLVRQHESLAAICHSLVKWQGHLVDAENLKSLSPQLKAFDRHDITMVHYLPMLMALIHRLGASETSCSIEDARALHQTIVSAKESDIWPLRNLQSAVVVWWVAVYSGRYVDGLLGASLQKVDLEAESEARSNLLMDALKDGAFHFMLSISQDVRPNKWHDPAKAGLISLLLHETPVLPMENGQPSEFFNAALMDQMQLFVEDFISNMPDTIRRLKEEEDDQRREMHSRFQRGPLEYELHLERFLIIISYAFNEDQEGSQPFWADQEGNLYGFLQWAARRQTTPRVAAFCEMLRSLSDGEDGATAAHNFLLDEGSSATGKLRRTTSLSYTQIFNELQIYSSNPKEKEPTPRNAAYPPTQSPLVEPESGMMLESYLRLVAHICRESTVAREWIRTHPTFPFKETLFKLCSVTLETRLRSCAFTCLTALLTNKTREIGEAMWMSVDQWLSDTSNIPQQKSAGPARSQQFVLEQLSANYDEANAFIALLQALIAPPAHDPGLNDILPFPETLGATYRMPGIDAYVDFAVGRVFGTKSAEIQDPLQLQILRFHCLGFIETCLATFNEDLVIFANRSDVAVDSVIGTSSLSAYARLHPFARVMEWMFNERTLTALFLTARQDVVELNDATHDTPLVQSLLRSIAVMDLIMKLQPTYLDIVRPLVKLHSSHRTPVGNSAIASFEDAVLNQLQLLLSLGLYCGTGYQDLTITSLNLLEKLSSSRKLVASTQSGIGGSDRSKVISIMQKNDDAERIARAMFAQMQLDPREVDLGPLTPAYVIKSSIIKFLHSCIEAVPNRPTVAHLLLGFSAHGRTIDVQDGSLFAAGGSLFHAIVQLALAYPDKSPVSHLSWGANVRHGALQLLAKLWRSPLASVYTMAELRANDFFFLQMIGQNPVDRTTLWDERMVDDPEFIFSDSSKAFLSFLQQRTLLYDYATRELRSAVKNTAGSLKSRIQSSLLGSTRLLSGEQFQNSTVFDLFDFIDLKTPDGFPSLDLELLGTPDFGVCVKQAPGSPTQYDLGLAQELLLLHTKAQRQNGVLITPEREQKAQEEMQDALIWLHGYNQYQLILQAHQNCLKAWVQLLSLFIQHCDLEQAQKTTLILQAYELILPKFEQSCSENLVTALDLADLCRDILQHVDFSSPALEITKAKDVTNNKLYQLFRTSLYAITSAVATPELRETCYAICYRYLQRTIKPSKKNSLRARQILKMVKSAGDRLVETICDDSYAGQRTCKLFALLLLQTLVSLENQENDSPKNGQGHYLLTSFARVNFIGVLVDGIKQIPNELGTAQKLEVPLLLQSYDASLALLLRISQTRQGAASVCNAGLFHAVKESRIFSTDPDIGLDFGDDDDGALKKFFALMGCVLRVVNAVVLSRGSQNDQTVSAARDFLRENRASVVAIFKRNARLGGWKGDDEVQLDELVDGFTLLISMTEFMEFEDRSSLDRSRSGYS